MTTAGDRGDDDHQQRCDQQRGDRRLNAADAARIMRSAVSAGLADHPDLNQPRLARWPIGVTRPLTPGHVAQYRAVAEEPQQGLTTKITVLCLPQPRGLRSGPPASQAAVLASPLVRPQGRSDENSRGSVHHHKTMRILRESDEAEMVAVFLQGELSSERFGTNAARRPRPRLHHHYVFARKPEPLAAVEPLAGVAGDIGGW